LAVETGIAIALLRVKRPERAPKYVHPGRIDEHWWKNWRINKHRTWNAAECLWRVELSAGLKWTSSHAGAAVCCRTCSPDVCPRHALDHAFYPPPCSAICTARYNAVAKYPSVRPSVSPSVVCNL